MTEQTGVWVHAVARGVTGVAGDRSVLSVEGVGVEGVGGRPVRVVESAGLVAIVSTVDLAEFGEQTLRRNLENLGWLETTARTHHLVVETVGRLGPVVPTRLATIYRDDRCVREMLAQRRADFTAVLDRVQGRVEWGVKVYAAADPAGDGDTAGTAAAGTAAAGTAAAGTGPGAQYLRRRRVEMTGREQVRRAVARDAEAVHEALADLADAARQHAAQSPNLTGRAEWMPLNGTYLVSDDRSTRFAAAVAALSERYPGLQLELTGPWPPYSFAVLDDADEGAGQ